MGKMTIVLSDEMEEKLRDHVRMKYRKPFGKISSVIEEAVKELLEKEGQEADERTHTR